MTTECVSDFRTTVARWRCRKETAAYRQRSNLEKNAQDNAVRSKALRFRHPGDERHRQQAVRNAIRPAKTYHFHHLNRPTTSARFAASRRRKHVEQPKIRRCLRSSDIVDFRETSRPAHGRNECRFCSNQVDFPLSSTLLATCFT